MIKIKPITFPLNKGTATKLKVVALQFDLLGTTTTVEWFLHTEEGQLLDRGYYTLTDQEYNTWGADNNYVINIVIAKLGLVKA